MDREGCIQTRVVVIAMDGSMEAESALQCKIFVYILYLYTYYISYLIFKRVTKYNFLNVNVKFI